MKKIKQSNKNNKFIKRRKFNFFDRYEIDYIDYKNVQLLSKFINTKKKIVKGKITGTFAKRQRKLAKAIKRARYMALLPYTNKHK